MSVAPETTPWKACGIPEEVRDLSDQQPLNLRHGISADGPIEE